LAVVTSEDFPVAIEKGATAVNIRLTICGNLA
jgi:uncharacterized pyridoxal phosphate-containing UPF0001 family protein